ncbi:COX15/CtaA family protein [Epidermidibacterium keratini]
MLITNVAIVVSGGAVRLTGSGLGCAQWPTCNEGNLFPTSEMPVHTYIEFTNRTFFFILAIVALVTWLVLRKLSPARPDLTRLALFIGLSIPAQGVIGGITVLTGLNPYTVMVHFLISMVLVFWAAKLYSRARDLERQPQPYANRGWQTLAYAMLVAAALTLILGTIVTGSGPHGGDPEAGRTGFDPELMSQLHADAVFLLVGLSLAAYAVTLAIGNPPPLRRAVLTLLGILAVQGVIGYTQYFTNLPIVLVGLHMLGAALVMMGVTYVTEELRYVGANRPKRDLPKPTDDNGDGFDGHSLASARSLLNRR